MAPPRHLTRPRRAGMMGDRVACRGAVRSRFSGPQVNHAFCNTCAKMVDARVVERGGQMFLVKTCPDCGETETLISGDAERYQAKRSLDAGFDYQSCKLDCLRCVHKPLLGRVERHVWLQLPYVLAYIEQRPLGYLPRAVHLVP